jgi:hypothetical protein
VIGASAHLPAIVEIVRVPAPAPAPQSLAHDGERLWVGSWQTQRIYALDPHDGTSSDEAAAPGKPVGCTVVGDELRFVLSERDDDRVIRRFVPGHGFKTSDAVPCPDDTGSFLAFDGEGLWLSQRYDKRVVRLDETGAIVRTIDVGEEIVGLALVGSRLFCSLWLGAKTGRCRIGFVDSLAEPRLAIVATLPFVGVSLANDGERFWTNDFKNDAIVAFELPGGAA